MTREIVLHSGDIALVDDADFRIVSHWKWKRHPQGYASRTTRSGTVLMHRQIMNAAESVEIDHRNGNKLDNRRGNLRIATKSQNMHNRGAQRNSKSGQKGVSWDVSRQKWRATIQVDGRYRTLGRFASLADAIACYERFAHEALGEFARTEAAG